MNIKYQISNIKSGLPYAIGYLLFAKPALAQIDISGLSYPDQKIQSGFNIADLLTKGGFNLVTFAFFIAGLIFFFNLLSAAWDYLLSTGDPKKIAGATQRLLNAFVGIVIVLASFVVVRLVLAMLGLQGLI